MILLVNYSLSKTSLPSLNMGRSFSKGLNTCLINLMGTSGLGDVREAAVEAKIKFSNRMVRLLIHRWIHLFKTMNLIWIVFFLLIIFKVFPRIIRKDTGFDRRQNLLPLSRKPVAILKNYKYMFCQFHFCLLRIRKCRQVVAWDTGNR